MKFLIIGIFGLLGFMLLLPTVSSLYELPSLEAPTEVSRPQEKQESKPTVPGYLSSGTVNFKNIDLNKGHTVYLTEPVTTESAKATIRGIQVGNLKKKPIYLLLDSPGGSVIDGAHIITAIQSSKQPVYTVCLEMCASMAAMILQYGTERYAVDRSIIMFHPASVTAMVQGELDKVVSRFQFMQRYIDKMDFYVAKRAGEPYDKFKAKSNREYYIDAEDALDYKLIDGVVRILDYQGVPENFGENRGKFEIDFTWKH